MNKKIVCTSSFRKKIILQEDAGAKYELSCSGSNKWNKNIKCFASLASNIVACRLQIHTNTNTDMNTIQRQTQIQKQIQKENKNTKYFGLAASNMVATAIGGKGVFQTG